MWLVTNTLAVGEEFHHHYQITESGLSIKTWIVYSIGLDFSHQLCFCFYCRPLLGHVVLRIQRILLSPPSSHYMGKWDWVVWSCRWNSIDLLLFIDALLINYLFIEQLNNNNKLIPSTIWIQFLAVLDLCCCMWAFFSCIKEVLLFVAVQRLFIVVASLVAEHRF